MGRRIDIEPDHVTQFVDELRIFPELELPITVRLQPVRFPDAPNRAGADAARPRHQIGRPVGRPDRRIGKSQRHHALGNLGAERRDARGPRLVMEQAMEIPARMRQTCTQTEPGGSFSGLFCQADTTRLACSMPAASISRLRVERMCLEARWCGLPAGRPKRPESPRTHHAQPLPRRAAVLRRRRSARVTCRDG